MKQNIEQAFINTVIAFKIMQYSQSLICFFKEEFKKDNGYIIPYSHILYVKRHIFPLIRDACDYVCPYTEECDGHKFLNFVEKLIEFQHHAVLEKKCYFGDFRFYNFRFKRDRVHGMEKIAGWDFNAFTSKDLSHLRYSQRAQYLK